VNALRAGHSEQRAGLCAGLGELQRCALEDEMGGVGWVQMKK
jgi:hypothetical protein